MLHIKHQATDKSLVVERIVTGLLLMFNLRMPNIVARQLGSVTELNVQPTVCKGSRIKGRKTCLPCFEEALPRGFPLQVVVHRPRLFWLQRGNAF